MKVEGEEEEEGSGMSPVCLAFLTTVFSQLFSVHFVLVFILVRRLVTLKSLRGAKGE